MGECVWNGEDELVHKGGERMKKEKERLRKEELEALDVWDGPMGECVWNGEDELEHKGDALVFDNQCKVLSEMDCINGGPYGRCQWVGFSHMHYPMLAEMKMEMEEMKMEEEMALGVDVRAILNMKVSTLDLLLGVAFVLTASFAMHQLYRWCSERREYKRMSRDEAAPLLIPATV